MFLTVSSCHSSTQWRPAEAGDFHAGQTTSGRWLQRRYLLRRPRLPKATFLTSSMCPLLLDRAQADKRHVVSNAEPNPRCGSGKTSHLVGTSHPSGSPPVRAHTSCTRAQCEECWDALGKTFLDGLQRWGSGTALAQAEQTR